MKLKLKKLVYNYIFLNKHSYVSVNCNQEKEKILKRYKIDRTQIFILTDCIAWKWPEEPFTNGDGYIFCGGSLRDWKVYFEAAKLLPKIKFVAVGGSNYLPDETVEKAPNNMKIYRDIPKDKFSELLAEATISVIAVPTTVPNGLTLVYDSAFLHRPIIATDTEAINNLLYSDESGLWGGIRYSLGNARDLADKIQKLFYDSEKRRELSENMYYNLSYHSAEAYSKRLLEFCDSIE